MLLDFLWEGPPKIKQNVLVKDYSEGGGGIKNDKY